MRRLKTPSAVAARRHSHHVFPHGTCAIAIAAVAALFCAWSQSALAQDHTPAGFGTDILGAHSNGGRGCFACHPPHKFITAGSPVESSTNAAVFWGQDAGPDYGDNLAIGEASNAVEFEPSRLASTDSEITGVLVCLSCHDGNVTPQNMMASVSYTQKIGLVPFFRGRAIPTFLEERQRANAIDHPLGVEARIETGNGLEFSGGMFSVRPQTPYAQFVASYGWPTLAPSGRSHPYGIDGQGRPYLVCTTCHNQHVMSSYVSQAENPIGGDGGAKAYATFFFVNGPYNPYIGGESDNKASSGTQFCRQCHFRNSNEGNNSYFIPTWFQ